ncbi:hypothetical protein [Desulfolucanica intricata]|uniref:hypothetical protein n=1 Tax=Desulfolucanica intricata TaxID=1285191 RepID=UPI000A45D1BE|nr:hypothetical protein [Desulfolucanica intricata]
MAAGVFLTVNASGAAEGARLGHVVVIVDVIDMSTTAEAAMDAGALAVFGASPDHAKPPVKINPQQVAEAAGELARHKNAGVVIIAEPRVGSDLERQETIRGVLTGLKKIGVETKAILPNLGAETPKLFNLKNCVVIAATGTGGVAFDAAFTAGAPAVLTATVARTLKKKGAEPAKSGVERAIQKARELKTGITVVGASGNSLEDILAAEYIVKCILQRGFM